MIEWARRAEARGFSRLATLDRIVYPSYDSLVSLAAAAAVTERIGLLTNILLAPTRNPVLLAKEAASVDQLSGGRLTLGLGSGGREDDFTAVGKSFEDRGRRFDELLDVVHRAWRGEPVGSDAQRIGPLPPAGRVPVLIGGMAPAAVRRTVEWGGGWTAGGAGAELVEPMAKRVWSAWKEAGKPGEPLIVALAYFALGDRDAESNRYIKDYYAYAPWADALADSVPRTVEGVRDAAKRFEDAGVDELVFDPTVGEIEQVDLLADAVL